jgi:hypothetical protein
MIWSKLKHGAGAAKLRQEWTGQYPPPYDWSLYQQDLDGVADALLNVPVTRAKGKPIPLAKLVEFSPKWDQDAKRFAADTLAGIGAQENSMRVLFASAQHAYRTEPAKFAGAAQRFLKRMRKACPDDLRHGEQEAPKGRAAMLRSLGENLLLER